MKRKKGTNLGDFDFDNTKFSFMQAPPDDSPFGSIEYTGDIEKDTKEELNEFQKAYRDKKRKYQKTIQDVFDSEFWFAVSFKNREECLNFLKTFGLDSSKKYFNGKDFENKIKKLIKKSERME